MTSIACFGLALACASEPASEPVNQPVASEPTVEPTVFVEAAPESTTAPDNAEQPSAAGASEQDREQAKVLYQAGAELFEVGDYAGALERFEQAYQLVPMPALRFNIARTRAQLGDQAGACAEYAELLADPEADDNLRQTAQHEIARLAC